MVSLHLDTDLGGDIDDLCALAMLLNWPDLNLVGITTVAEHHGKRAGYVQYALGLTERNDIPVASGADASLGVYRSWPALPDETRYWPEPVAPKPAKLDEALSLLESSIEKGAIIAAIGPYTNLALLERRRPGILQGARICLMGGYLFPPRHGFPDWNHEMDYNTQVDAESALVVFQHSAPTLVPIAVTAETSLRRTHVEALRRSSRPSARLIARQAEVFAEDEKFEAVYGARYSQVPNHTEYLRDETGARRFWPVLCGSIDIEALARDRDQLWTEAKHRYSCGEKWWLDTAALVEIAAEEQAARYQGDPWEEVIAPWLEARTSVSISEVLDKCVCKPQAQWTQADKNRVGRCLRSLGWARYRERDGERLDWRWRRVAR